MKKTKKQYIVAGALGVTMITLGAVGAVDAAQRDSGQRMSGQGGGQRDGGHLQVAADMIGVSVGDLQTRVSNGEHMRDILEASGVSRDDMRAAHQNKMQERMDDAVASGRITEEQAAERKAKMLERQGNREAVRVAVENNDYEAWSTAVASTPMASKVTAENFVKIVEAHALREAGDHEVARAIMQELGFDKGGMHGGKMGHRGMNR